MLKNLVVFARLCFIYGRFHVNSFLSSYFFWCVLVAIGSMREMLLWYSRY